MNNNNNNKTNHKSLLAAPSEFTSKENFCIGSGLNSGAVLSIDSEKTIFKIFLRKADKSVFGITYKLK